MARRPLRAITFILAAAGTIACTTGGPIASAKVYSFKPSHASNGTVLFLVRSVRPKSVRAAHVRVGGSSAQRVSLRTARRAARSGKLRVSAPQTTAGEPSSTIAQGSVLSIVADTTQPETTITSGPSGTVTSRSASFEFTSPETRARFECRLDSGDWNRCRSPKSYSKLAYRSHAFFVRAYDKAGNVDPTPATRTWTVSSAAPPPPEPEPTPVPTEPPPSGGAMFDGFEAANGPNDLITNEYAGWHSSDSTAVQSPIWNSDGGSLFSVTTTGENGETVRAAYTGKLDNSAADKYSQTYTHSDKMRFWTKASGFENVRIDADIKPMSWSPEAPSTWGGFKFYLRRQVGETESPFYTVEPYIKDGYAYIQKKCLGNTGGGTYSTGGTYYLLASKPNLGVPLGGWHKIAATAMTNPDGSVTIGLYRDGALVLQAVDHGAQSGTGCAPLIGGHVGFRSDFIQYYLDNFRVSTLE